MGDLPAGPGGERDQPGGERRLVQVRGAVKARQQPVAPRENVTSQHRKPGLVVGREDARPEVEEEQKGADGKQEPQS